MTYYDIKEVYYNIIENYDAIIVAQGSRWSFVSRRRPHTDVHQRHHLKMRKGHVANLQKQRANLQKLRGIVCLERFASVQAVSLLLH